jgi:curved DNA-binding protein CbpA
VSEARARTPKLVPNVSDTRAFQLSTTEGFLLSCIDGVTSESDLALVTGRDHGELQALLSRLEALGLITIEETAGGERPVAAAHSSAPPRASSVPRASQTVPPRPTAAPAAAWPGEARTASGSPRTREASTTNDEDVELEPKLRAELVSIHAALDQLDHYALLGIPRSSDKQAIKRAYYEQAAKFHPDRYFRKRLGSFKVRLEAVFSRLTLAHETLSVPEKKTEYDAYLDEQRRLRGIEKMLAGSAAETERVRESVEREVRADQPAPVMPAVDRRMPSARPNPSTARPSPTTARPGPSPEVGAASRREAFARRLLGGRTGSGSLPPVTSSAPPTTADAMEALRRRYEDRVAAARNAEARRYAGRAEAALKANEVANAASSFEVAAGLAPDDEDLKQRAADARARAQLVLGDTYRKQAEYEEKNGQWPEAARSWVGVCKASPDDGAAHRRAADALVRAGGNLTEALRLAQRASAIGPPSSANHATLGRVHLAAGRNADAQRELEAAAKLAPNDDEVQQMLKKARKQI